MSTGKRLAGLLLFTTALTLPSVLAAQDAQPDADGAAEQAEETPPEEEVQDTDISVPGGGIIVTGRRNRDPARSSSQVLTVLSEADIARTGEGDIAGALGRVSGLSLVGNGRVFVRGLGDRYSLALLNGLPLPSPEPLSRVVPLDIFPTSVISSSLVQKTYSANFPGEFGGGVINLTTKAIPTENFLTVSLGTSGVLFAANDGYQPAPETAVHTFCHALPDTWHQMGVILACTDALNWFAGLAGADAAALTGDLGPLRAPGRTVFLPYLGGERTPLNSASVRGAFLGLEHATDRAAATRALLEGTD